MHLKGRLSINLVVLAVMLLLDGETFLVREEVFVPVLSVAREETLCSCPSDLLQSRSKEASL
jgi:acyl-CoA reductase-like NAD-dependent aldehyde dehydrogenase